MADPHWKNARGSASRNPRAGDPLQGPRYAPFCDTLDVSPSLERQMTFKFNETKFIMTVSKRDSQRHKNYIDTMSALQEKPPKPRIRGEKLHRRSKIGPRSPPPGELDHGRSANGRSPLEKCQGVG